MGEKRVYMILQDAEIFRALNNLLRETGHAVHAANDPRQAIYSIAAFKPDLVICEEDLPRISGRQLGRLFKSHKTLSKAPFLLATRRAASGGGPTGETRGPDGYLRLPLDNQDLIEVLGRRLDAEDEFRRILSQTPAALLALQGAGRRRDAWRSGGLSVNSLARMFVRLIATNATGALRVAGDRKMLRALVRDSDLIDVHSTHLRDQTLGRHLRTQSVITEEMEENAFALSIDLRVPYGQALMMLGALNRDQLVQHLTNHKVAKLTRVFAPEWSPAHLEFTPARADRRLEGMKPSALTEILYSGVMKTAAHKDVYDTFVRTNRMTRQMTLSKDFADIARLLRLPADDLARAKRFAGHTIQEVGTLNPMDFAHNLRLAFLLAAAKAIAFRPASAEDRRALDEDLGPLTAATPPEEREILPCDFEAFQRAVVVAEALLTERNYREARERLRLACDINPHSSHALALLAWTEFMLGGRVNPGLCQDLKEMLKNAIALDDCNALAYLYLGKILREEGKHGLAMGVLTRAAQLNPMHREIRMEMAGAKRT